MTTELIELSTTVDQLLNGEMPEQYVLNSDFVVTFEPTSSC